MRDSLRLDFRKNWKQQGFNQHNDIVLLACSGGVDSMVLAHLLLVEKIPFAIAHCHFGLRAADADADKLLVETWTKSNNITFHTVAWDTKQEAEKLKMGIQEAARELRYNWLEEIRTTHNYSYLATAHHMGDVAETVLQNLMRGCGISGLHGILPIVGKLIRPLLFAEKEELLDYAKANDLQWREDASNQDNKYSRNAIRNVVLPAMQEIYPNSLQNIAATAERLADAELLYQAAVAGSVKKLLDKRGADYYISLRKLKKSIGYKTLLWEILKPFGFESNQMSEVLNLMGAENNKLISSGSHRMIKADEFFIITKNSNQNADHIIIEKGVQSVETANGTLSLHLENYDGEVSKDPMVAVVDVAKIQWPLVLRRRAVGDYFYPLGMPKKKKVGKFLSDLKMPIHEKEKQWLLTSDKRVVWIAGLRIDDRYKVSPSTTEVLVMKWKP